MYILATRNSLRLPFLGHSDLRSRVLVYLGLRVRQRHIALSTLVSYPKNAPAAQLWFCTEHSTGLPTLWAWGFAGRMLGLCADVKETGVGAKPGDTKTSTTPA